MEVLDPHVEVMTNMEVMNFVRTIVQQKGTKKKYGLRNLATITYETLQYMESTPCDVQTRENIVTFCNAIQQYKLTKSELLQMVNEPPQCPLHIQLIVEDSDERLTESQMAHIIKLSKKLLRSDD